MIKERDKWINSICVGVLFNTIIIYLWVPLFASLPPGSTYRPMVEAAYSVIVILIALTYCLILIIRRVKEKVNMKLKIFAIIMNIMPLGVMFMIIFLLSLRGNICSP